MLKVCGVGASLVILSGCATNPMRGAYVDHTAAMPESAQKETVLPDGAIMVEYEAPETDEIGIRKFMSGPDGIYAFAYHVRKAHRTDDKYNLWRQIVAETKLFPNPERRR